MSRIQEPKLLEVVTVLCLFLVIMFLSVSTLALPIQLALFASWFLFIGLGLKLKHTYKELQDSILTGIYNGLEATLVLFTVGALIGTWIAGGVVPGLIYYGLQMIHPSIFLLATMIICSITSLATGTSFGTAGTAGIAMMGIGASFGVPLPLVAGAVLSGAYFGDKLSPLSDTTVMTASLSKIDVIDHVKGMLFISVPTYIITAVLFTVVGLFYVSGSADLSRAESVATALGENFSIHWYTLLPAVIVIALLAMKKPSIPTISFGALLGILWAIWFQGMDSVEAIKTAYNGFSIDSGIDFLDSLLNAGGIEAMLGVIALILLALGLGGLMDRIGVLYAFSSMFKNWVENGKEKKSGRLTVSTVLSAFFGNFFGSAAYVSMITGTKITEKLYDEMGADRRALSRNTEAGGTLTAPMVPWSDAGVYMTAVLGVSTLEYLPFMWLNFISIIVTVYFGYKGRNFWLDKKSQQNVDQSA
ncbi:Na+/H+ antiporter NhaC [Aquibacillus sp. 3ASR75-11]|uniref:Na+/H+ antiporter NhaC n=1 Tax=Terrihalobacillus insolitus TaxID=2950438 RepID=A0A9X3WY52_9BACI|nr:Na+/H+ antiporter NhaC [Terrihalobacillus insolitus]MDC3425449.1 Na+/H+ antiporter NhaC [Terrihalobacillus insolitus]